FHGRPFVQSRDAVTGAESGRFEAPADAGHRLELGPDGRVAAVFDRTPDQPVRVFEVATGRELYRLSAARAVAFSPDGGRLVTAGPGPAVAVHDAATGAALW